MAKGINFFSIALCEALGLDPNRVATIEYHKDVNAIDPIGVFTVTILDLGLEVTDEMIAGLVNETLRLDIRVIKPEGLEHSE